MNTGGKYDTRAFKKSVGLNGVGTKAVTLSHLILKSNHLEMEKKNLFLLNLVKSLMIYH